VLEQNKKRAALVEASANLNTTVTNRQTNHSKKFSSTKVLGTWQRHLIYLTLLNFLKIRNFRRNNEYLEVIQDVPKRLWQTLKETDKEILVFRTAPLPTKLENGVICQELTKLFGLDTLLLVNGFILLTDVDENGSIIESARLDVFPYPHGFIVPIYEGKFIRDLQISRNPDDLRPFILRSEQRLIHLTQREVNGYA
jgi:hypothetical protein